MPSLRPCTNCGDPKDYRNKLCNKCAVPVRRKTRYENEPIRQATAWASWCHDRGIGEGRPFSGIGESRKFIVALGKACYYVDESVPNAERVPKVPTVKEEWGSVFNRLLVLKRVGDDEEVKLPLFIIPRIVTTARLDTKLIIAPRNGLSEILLGGIGGGIIAGRNLYEPISHLANQLKIEQALES